MCWREYLPSSDTQTFLIVSVVSLSLYSYLRCQSWRRLPPGPPCLPFLGSLPFLRTWRLDIREPLRRLGTTYGDVYTVYLGQRRVVVLNSYEAIQEALVDKARVFRGRPNMFFISRLTKGMGVACASGQTWQEQRPFAAKFLHQYTSNSCYCENAITEEVHYFLKRVAGRNGQGFNPRRLFTYVTTNVMGRMITGKRMDYHSEKLKCYVDIMEDIFTVIGASGPLTVIPVLQKFPFDPLNCANTLKLMQYMRSEYRQIIQEHKAVQDLNSEPQNFIDAYLREIACKNGHRDSTFSEEQLVQVIGDMYAASIKTTTMTFCWALLYLLHNPHVIQALQHHIDTTIRPKQVVSMKDMARLPYMEAFLMEVQRLADVTPYSMLHCTEEDVEFRGYNIPRGTIIVPNLYSVHMDQKHFTDPARFYPERFLDTDGSVKKVKQFIPFSVGARSCPAVDLVHMQLFLVMTSLLQHFTPVTPSGHHLPDLAGCLYLAREPCKFVIAFKSRTHKTS